MHHALHVLEAPTYSFIHSFRIFI